MNYNSTRQSLNKNKFSTQSTNNPPNYQSDYRSRNYPNNNSNYNPNSNPNQNSNPDNNYQRSYDDDRKPRFKGIRSFDRSVVATEENQERFNYASNANDLMDKDDIKCSEEALTGACDSFDDMGGEVGLKEDLLRGIYAYGFETPSRIQQLTIPQIINGMETLAQSQSGTGKTGAFMISALQKIDVNINAPQAIILSPTCELAQQTYIVGKAMSQFMTGVKFSFTVGGADRNNNIRELGGVSHEQSDDTCAQIIIATPGRLIDLLDEFPELFTNIKLIIVDECDELLSGTFRDTIKSILIALSKNGPVQKCLFSATLIDEVVKLADQMLVKPIKILIKKEKMTLEGIKQTYVDINRPEDKVNVLMEMLATLPIQQFIVYVNSKKNGDMLKELLERESYAVLTINSSMTKYDRAEIIRVFKQGGIKCLISTDLLARGIDIQQLSLVINYDLPRADNIQSYIHRIGRTGRYGRNGLSINLVTKYEKDVQNLISLTFKCQILPLEKDFVKYI